jgi:c-di-GMP-binding flagellar brake protein YcgR
MYAIKGLSVGDRVSLIYRDRSFPCIIQEMPTPDTIVIVQPLDMGAFVDITGTEKGEILFYRDNGMMSFQVRQDAGFLAKGVPMLRLKAVSETVRSQRRNYFRLEKSLPAELAIKSEHLTNSVFAIKARTINISGGGCRLAVRQFMENGLRVRCKIALDQGSDVILDGQVVWVERPVSDDRPYLIGVQFAGQETPAQKRLVAYVMDEQRKQLKR